MATIHVGATLTPHFRDFLPGWVARQPWFLGAGRPSLSPVGYFRFEDPAGEVGIETHLVRDGSVLYQVPMTYRPSPIGQPGQESALITTAEHSVLGTRWIYDGAADPVWANELRRLVRTEGVSDPSSRSGVGPAEARGRRLAASDFPDSALDVELIRVLTPGRNDGEPGIAGVVTGIWYPEGADGPPADGCLALLWSPSAHDPR